MRIAVLSDIHGNLGALEAVLADASKRGFDLMVNLGDICSGPLQPRETADHLIPLDLPTIRGNHERQLLAADLTNMGASDRFAREALDDRHRTWLEALPTSLSPATGVLLVHGTPNSDVEYWLETLAVEGLREATKAEIEQRAGQAQAGLFLCGHTHLPRTRRLSNGSMVVNPGSVGLPAYEDDRPFPHAVETGSPHARYAIVEGAGTDWRVEMIVVAYDWAMAALTAQDNGRPDWARALTTGRV